MKRLFGVTDQVVNSYLKKNSYPVFFKPYKDPTDFFYRAAAIITAPILHAGVAAIFSLAAACYVVKAVLQFLGWLLFDSTNKGLRNAANSIHAATLLFVGAVVHGVAASAAPIMETLDVAGSAVTTAMKASKPKREAISAAI